MAAADETPPVDVRREGRSLLLLGLAFVIIVGTTLTLMDRQLLTSERQELMQEIASLRARIEASPDVIGMRLEIQNQGQEIDALRRQLNVALGALGMVGRGEPALRALPLTPTGGGDAWGVVLVPDGPGRGYACVAGMTDLPRGMELVLVGGFTGVERELVRLVPDHEGQDIEAFDLGPPAPPVRSVWVRSAPEGSPPAGAALLSYITPAPAE